jgi:hypothetical protein
LACPFGAWWADPLPPCHVLSWSLSVEPVVQGPSAGPVGLKVCWAGLQHDCPAADEWVIVPANKSAVHDEDECTWVGCARGVGQWARGCCIGGIKVLDSGDPSMACQPSASAGGRISPPALGGCQDVLPPSSTLWQHLELLQWAVAVVCGSTWNGRVPFLRILQGSGTRYHLCAAKWSHWMCQATVETLIPRRICPTQCSGIKYIIST